MHPLFCSFTPPGTGSTRPEHLLCQAPGHRDGRARSQISCPPGAESPAREADGPDMNLNHGATVVGREYFQNSLKAHREHASPGLGGRGAVEWAGKGRALREERAFLKDKQELAS